METGYSSTILAIIAFPACSFLIQALLLWSGLARAERITASLVSVAFTGSVFATLWTAGLFLAGGKESIAFSSGASFSVGEHEFIWRFLADRLSLAYSLVCATLTGLIGAFSIRYMHREPGFHRFYLLLTLFGTSVQLIVLAGNLELVIFGWELVGISSALLIAFFHDRMQPMHNAVRAYATYRLCDIGLLFAIIICHRVLGSARFALVEEGYWGALEVPTEAGTSLVLLAGLLVACMGKSALFPVGGWLPRAMEGPTPSSAIFYGAISIHLGPFLLLRAWPIIESSILGASLVVAVGLLTAVYGTLVCRVQTDIKNTLAFASMTQVGLIVAEIGLGLYYLALLHSLGHAIFRTIQILQSPDIIQTHEKLERLIGTRLPQTGVHYERLFPSGARNGLYRFSLERGYLDEFLFGLLIVPVTRLCRHCDVLEQRWVCGIASTLRRRGKKQ